MFPVFHYCGFSLLIGRDQFFQAVSDLSCMLYNINACHILFKVSENWKKFMKLNKLLK